MATTINKIIERADMLRENSFSDDGKAIWINQVEQTVQRDIMKLDDPVQLTYPEDGDKELTLSGEWESLYVYFVVAMIDYWNQDTNLYNVSAKMYNDTFDEFRRQYKREHPVGSSSFIGLL